MTQPHILIPVHDFNAGGTEAIALRLAGEWLARGWRVTVLAGDTAGPMLRRVPSGAQVLIVDPPMARSTFSRIRLGKAMASQARQAAPDVIFIPGNFHFILAHALKQALPRVPIVAKISNPLLPKGWPETIARAIGGPLLRKYFGPIDRVVAMTEGQRREFLALCPSANVPIIPDPNVPDHAVVQQMKDRRASDGPIEMLLIGRLEPQKNVALAIEVLGALNRLREARLTVLGEGYMRPAIEAQAARLGLSRQLTMPGFSNDIPAALRAADVLLISSDYEGGPGVASEALAEALPIVSTDCSHYLREILIDPRLGRWVKGRDPEQLARAVLDQMNEAPAPHDLLERLVKPSRYSVAAEAYLQLFEAALGKRSA